MVEPQSRYQPGTRVRVTQQIPRQEFGGGPLTTTIEGELVSYVQAKTGSWFAHSKDHKLWLERLEIKKDNGELVMVNLDQYSLVDVI